MKTLLNLFISLLILCPIVYSVGIGIEVTDPNDCDTGLARLVANANGSSGKLYCTDSNAGVQWSHPLNYMQNASHFIVAQPISEEAIEVQMELAESATIWSSADEIYWEYKFGGYDAENLLGIKDFIHDVWMYIWAFFVLIFEVVKLIFYIVEMLIVIYVLFTLIPETFFKLRDALVKSYIRRYAT